MDLTLGAALLAGFISFLSPCCLPVVPAYLGQLGVVVARETPRPGLTPALAGASPYMLLPLVMLYAITVPADSGALTAGMSMSAHPENRGATMAVHSTVGFGLSALGAWCVGAALDATGGPDVPSAWSAAFAVLAAGVLMGPLALKWSRTTQDANTTRAMDSSK